MKLTITRALSFLVLWPMPMYGSAYIFSKKFFTGWVTVSIIWILFSFLAVGIYPLWESRETLVRVTSLILRGGRSQKNVVTEGDSVKVEESSGSVTPVRTYSLKD